MLAEIGLAATFLAFFTSLYAIGASFYGERFARSEAIVLSGRNAVLVTFALMTTALVALSAALMMQQYQVAYVWSVSSPPMPDFFRFTALWGSQAGSLLFWTFLMSAFAAAAVMMNWKSHRRLMPYAICYMMATVAFFVALVILFENPFDRWWIIPTNPTDQQVVKAGLMPFGGVAPDAATLAGSAQGLNPLLRHVGMAIHPPMLYLGFVAFVIPFAFAMGALASGDLSTNWIKATRRWALVAWLFLSLGLLLGSRWAYDVLGWGGYWGWDPVENAAFLPWLIGTAFLHSVMIQEKRGMLKVWNMFLVIGTFSAVIFGTFATRSGLVDSVHSFARSEIGFPMFFFWGVMTIVSVGLILWRRNRGELRDEHSNTNLFSRESLFMLNNFIFAALFISIFWGSFGAPIISELIMNTNITLGADYFMRVTPPLFAALYILMGIAPLSAWGKTSLSRLGQALIIPLVLTGISLVLFYISGVHSAIGLLAYGIVMIAGWVAVYETYRGVMARRQAHKESYLKSVRTLISRNPRRYGGYMIHVGITILGLGAIGSTAFQQQTQQTLALGDTMEFAGFTMRYDDFTRATAEDGRDMDIAKVTVLRDGQELARLSPRRDFFTTANGMQPSTIAGSYSTLESDFYVLLVGGEENGGTTVTFKIYLNPLINLLWYGGIILMLGTGLAVWPSEVLPERVRKEVGVYAPDGLARKGV